MPRRQPPAVLSWKLPAILEREGLRPSQVERVAGIELAPSTVYRLCSSSPSRVDLETVAILLWALRQLTGRPYGVEDVLEYVEAAPE